MPDREKVINSIKGCLNIDGYCNDCDYDGCVFEYGFCKKDLLADALELLKEQGERVGKLTEDQSSNRQIKKEEQNMELKDTVELMQSEDWKERFVAEYLQTKIRYEKLHWMIIKREAGRQEFNTPIPLESWKTQANIMGRYLYELEKQAAIHGIELPITILAVK